MPVYQMRRQRDGIPTLPIHALLLEDDSIGEARFTSIIDARGPGADIGERVECGRGATVVAVCVDLENGPTSSAESAGRQSVSWAVILGEGELHCEEGLLHATSGDEDIPASGGEGRELGEVHGKKEIFIYIGVVG